MSRVNFASLLLLCASPWALIGNAYSQSNRADTDQTIEEIIVSVDYRQASINDIPASITVLDSSLIEQKNAQHLEEILANAANVNFSSGASRARFYQIRGIGERGQFSTPLNSSVGVIIDGVDFSGIGNAAMLYDIEQVEILMGPQGTRYGSNALAGLINLQSKAATQTFSYGTKIEAANYNSNGLAGYISGPLSDNLLYRVSLQKLESDGFSDNDTLNKPTNDRDETTLRSKLNWVLNDDISLDLNATFIDIDNGYDAFSLDNVRDTLSDEPGFDRQESTLISSRLRAENFDNFRLEAIIGYGNSDIEYGYDEDWVFTGFNPAEYSSFDQYVRDRETLSAELRLISNEDGALFGGKTSWITGIYSLQQEVNLTRTYTYLSEDFTSGFDIDRLAIFADTSTSLASNWSIDIGLRAERFDSSYKDSYGVSFSPSENLYGGKVSLNYQTANDNLLYLSASRGYKAGGFNTDGSLLPELRIYDTEGLWNYEAGFKGSLFNDSLQTQIAIFYMDRMDVQISTSYSIPGSNPPVFYPYTGNATSGKNYGFEVNSNWQLNQQVNIYSAIGLLKSKYGSFINSKGDNLNGRSQAHAPQYQYTLGTDITLSSQWQLNINIQGKDEFYFSDSHGERSDAYHLLNASLSYQLQQWRFTLWARNLNDQDYFVRGFSFGNDPRDFYQEHGYTQLGEPRRIGLTISADF